jgi:predicted amidohydrolase
MWLQNGDIMTHCLPQSVADKVQNGDIMTHSLPQSVANKVQNGDIMTHSLPQSAADKVQNDDIMTHYLPQSAADMHHPQYGTIANVRDTHANCLFGVSARTYGTHSENTL